MPTTNEVAAAKVLKWDTWLLSDHWTVLLTAFIQFFFVLQKFNRQKYFCLFIGFDECRLIKGSTIFNNGNVTVGHEAKTRIWCKQLIWNGQKHVWVVLKWFFVCTRLHTFCCLTEIYWNTELKFHLIKLKTSQNGCANMKKVNSSKCFLPKIYNYLQLLDVIIKYKCIWWMDERNVFLLHLFHRFRAEHTKKCWKNAYSISNSLSHQSHIRAFVDGMMFFFSFIHELTYAFASKFRILSHQCMWWWSS